MGVAATPLAHTQSAARLKLKQTALLLIIRWALEHEFGQISEKAPARRREGSERPACCKCCWRPCMHAPSSLETHRLERTPPSCARHRLLLPCACQILPGGTRDGRTREAGGRAWLVFLGWRRLYMRMHSLSYNSVVCTFPVFQPCGGFAGWENV
ncbi:hypothetical protein BDY17DRAFT_302959, partial [Neohortaea acidophila]